MKQLALGIASALLLAACGGGSDSGSDPDPDGSTAVDGGGGGDTDGGGPPDDGGGTDGPYRVTFGPIDVPAGTERTQCIIQRLGNTEPVHVGRIENRLGNSSHHMILYRVNDTEERREPFDCTPFRDTLDPERGSPLAISQKAEDTIELPDGVGFSLDANQMVRLEMHYINTRTETVTLETSSTMYPIPESELESTADFLFIGSPDIDIPARSEATLGPVFFPLPSEFTGDANFFAITGHEHQYGTDVRVWSATGPDDPGEPVYEVADFLWDEPANIYHDPPFTVPDGGGFRFRCEWNNTSDSNVGFGESANDEMCFFWAYYYPARGTRVCFHTDMAGGIDVCCPSSHPACDYL